MEGVATLIDGVHTLTQNGLVVYAQTSRSTLINTTGAIADYTSGSVSVTVSTGDIVEIHADISWSCSLDPATLGMQLRRDSTDIGFRHDYVTARSSTGGIDNVTSLNYIDAPGAGTYTYKIRWLAGTGTAYSQYLNIYAKVLQNT